MKRRTKSWFAVDDRGSDDFQKKNLIDKLMLSEC